MENKKIMSIEQKRDQLVDELMPFEDHLERFSYVIERAKDAPGLDQEYKIDTFLIKGCVLAGYFLNLRMVNVSFRQIPMHPSPGYCHPAVWTTAEKAHRM